jgi:hypothetical protein
MLRRSMPWAKAHDARASSSSPIGESLDRYERVLHRMLGLDDGVRRRAVHLFAADQRQLLLVPAGAPEASTCALIGL